MNLVNANIKRLYADFRRKRWNNLCEKLDSRTATSKLWKLAKNIDRIQPQVERSNTFKHPDGSLCIDRGLRMRWEDIIRRRVDFLPEDKLIAKSARVFIHKRICNPGVYSVFYRDFTSEELDIAFHYIDFNKSTGVDQFESLGQNLPS